MEFANLWEHLFFFGKCKDEFQSSSLPVLGRNSTAVNENRVFYNRKSQACASSLRERLIYPVKTLEQTVQMLGRHTYACI